MPEQVQLHIPTATARKKAAAMVFTAAERWTFLPALSTPMVAAVYQQVLITKAAASIPMKH